MILGIVMAAPADIEVGAVLLPALAAQPAVALALLVALYIVAAYWFTASTSFANPAVTLARSGTCSSRSL